LEAKKVTDLSEKCKSPSASAEDKKALATQQTVAEAATKNVSTVKISTLTNVENFKKSLSDEATADLKTITDQQNAAKKFRFAEPATIPASDP